MAVRLRPWRQGLSCLALLAAACAGPAWADGAGDWPNRPIRVVVPAPAGNNIDVLFRTILTKVGPRLGQPIVVDNKPGASSIIGVQDVARAAPDGYTMLMTVMSSFVGNRVLYKSLPYDPVKGFEPITQIAYGNVIMIARADAPYRDIKQFVAWARQQARPVTYGTNGVGTTLHVFGAKLGRDARLNVTNVPYKQSGLAIQDAATGGLDVAFTSMSDARPFVESGKIRVLGVTGADRIENLPDVPTFGEQGFPGFDLAVWTGAYFPAGTPQPIVDRMNRTIVEVLRMPDIRQAMLDLGHVPIGTTQAQFKANYAATFSTWEDYIQATGAQAE